MVVGQRSSHYQPFSMGHPLINTAILFALDDDSGAGLLSEAAVAARVARRSGIRGVIFEADNAELAKAPLSPHGLFVTGTNREPAQLNSALLEAAVALRRAVSECEPSVHWAGEGAVHPVRFELSSVAETIHPSSRHIPGA